MKLPRANSVFVKLLLVLAVFAVAINFLVFISFRHIFMPNRDLRELGHRNLARYAAYVVGELGDPPRREKALEIERELGIGIRMESAEGSWATDETLPSLAELQNNSRRRHQHSVGNAQAGRENGRYYLLLAKGGRTFALFTPDGSWFAPRWEAVAMLIAFLTAFVGGLFIALRRLLRPVRGLQAGVQALAGGDLAYRVDARSRDEFGALAQAFNQMAARVGEMLRARDQLLLDVSHELRSPITRMKVALEFLPGGNPREQLNEDVRELEHMVTEILDAARLDQHDWARHAESFDLSKLVEEAVARVDSPAAAIACELAPAVTVVGDQAMLRRAIVNLLENAVKYGSAGTQPISVRLEGNGKTVRLAVRDYGPGVPAEELPRLTEPYYRVDKSRTKATGGYGLGLNIAKKIIEAHQGTLTLTLPPGGGLQAEVWLPARR